MKIKGRKLVQSERRGALKIARKQILNHRISYQIKNERNKERFEAEFEWKKPEPYRR